MKILSICYVIVTEKCQRKVESRPIIPDPSRTETKVGECGWAKSHMTGPNHKKQPIRRAVRWPKALEKEPPGIIIIMMCK